MQIDAHQHFWKISRGDYGWMDGNEAVVAIKRDFLPEELSTLIVKAGIDKTILVQAAPSIDETKFLLDLSDANTLIAGVVGWIDFEKPEHRKYLDQFSKHEKFLGIRPMIQDIPDPNWMHRPDVQWGFEALIEYDLTFDALGFVEHIEAFDQLFSRYPAMRAVIDHAMKPNIRGREFDNWSASIRRLAKHNQVYCKCSGLLTEAKSGDGIDRLKPYIDVLMDAFKAERLMWGSDWPVLNLAGDYLSWYSMIESYAIDNDCEARLLGGTAAEFYRLDIA